MKYFIVFLSIICLSGCSKILADDDSMLDQAGYSTYSGLNQDPNPGMETSTKMVNAAIKR